jgi:hypothetical protein
MMGKAKNVVLPMQFVLGEMQGHPDQAAAGVCHSATRSWPFVDSTDGRG